MKILFIGDPHLKINRFDLALQFLKWVNETIKAQRPDLIVNLGDTFDTHAILRTEIMKEFKDHVDFCSQYSKHGYYYVLGNHDAYKPKDSKYHALQTMECDNFVVVDRVLEWGAENLTFVPYQADVSKFPTKTDSICIAHQAFVGADFGGWRPKEGVVDADTISAEIIISGHIHIRQSFGKVVYPGTPYSQSLKDVDQTKGVMMFDTASYKQTFIECPLPMWKRLTFEINDQNSISDIHSDLLTQLNNKDHWTVDISGPRAELISYRDSKEWTTLLNTYDIKMNPTFTDKSKKLVSIKAISIAKIASDYFDNVYKGNIDKEVLKSRAQEIISLKK